MEPRKYQSDDVSKLIPALIEARKEMPALIKNKEIKGRGFYADHTAVIKTIEPSLLKYGLYLHQYEEEATGKTVYLITKITHISGQWILSVSTIISREAIAEAKGYDMSLVSQENGKQQTYAKRTAITSLLGISGDDEDADDDLIDEPVKKDYSDIPRITSEQMKVLDQALLGYPKLRAKLLKECFSKDGTFACLFASKLTSVQEAIKKQYALKKDID